MIADWIAVDWGTSRLRVWAMQHQTSTPLAMRQSERGMSALTPDAYETALLELVHDWLNNTTSTLVLVCGMAGAREGWREAGYLSVPLQLPQQLSTIPVPTQDGRLNVHILPGLKQLQPADVMRGEETQLSGFISQQPDFDGIVVLPGTHSKWVRLQQGMVLQFSTLMTGELFALLRQHSILRHAIADQAWEADAFNAAFLQAIAQPLSFGQRLFALRADGLLNGQSKTTAYAKLSAEILAIELNAARAGLLSSNTLPIALIGNAQLTALYHQALDLLGYAVSTYSGENMVLDGLNYLSKNFAGAPHA